MNDSYSKGYEKGYQDALDLILQQKNQGIDNLVEENRKELEELHNKFRTWDEVTRHWMCECPICRSLELGGDAQCHI
jgi:hypothetical protein